MALTPNLGLTITPLDESTKRFVDFRSEIAGDSPTSNMVIIDTEFGKLLVRIEEYENKTTDHFTDEDAHSNRFDEVNNAISDVQSTVSAMNNIGLINVTVTVPVSAWVEDETLPSPYICYADAANSAIKEAHYPIGTPTIDCIEQAQLCGMAPIVQTLDGSVRFYAESIPESLLTIDLALWEK